ncbi:MAG TPA: hypothetical protein EYO59_02520, partial [Chromatiaceae bacterium]|nr:hypothetical protein [Chromatiaceae bacterium]
MNMMRKTLVFFIITMTCTLLPTSPVSGVTFETSPALYISAPYPFLPWSQSGYSKAGVATLSATSKSPRLSAGTNWLQRFNQQLEQLEYRVSKDAVGQLQAPNRAHDVRTYFDGKGIRVHRRMAADNYSPLLALSLSGFGRGNDLVPVQQGKVKASADVVEIVRPGLLEWYKNSAQGLEQGFVVQQRSPGMGPLVLELKVDFARARLVGQVIELTTRQGQLLQYDKLNVVDASGRVLASRFALPSPQRLQLVVDDHDGQYPLVIDPLLTNVADKILESNIEDPSVGFSTNAFGSSVSTAGDVNGDGFADILVGAPLWDGGEAGEGAVFVFLGGASGIVGSNPVDAHVRIESNQIAAGLGTLPCSVTGDVNNDGFDDIIVGAPTYQDVLPGTALQVDGAAFMFYGSAAGITGTGPADADVFIRSIELRSALGVYVSGAGDINNDGYADVLVGVPGYGLPFPAIIPANQRSGNFGAALVFHGGPAGVTGTGFSDADRVILSFDDTGQLNPTIFGQIGNVCGAGDVNNDGFDDIFLGGTEATLFIGSTTGIVGTDLTQAHSRVFATPALPIVDSIAGPGVGYVVARAGDVNADGFTDLLASIPFRDAVPASTTLSEGSAYVHLGSAMGLVVTPEVTYLGVQGAEVLGNTLSGIGDFDNDGFDDIAIGARVFPGSLNDEGIAYILRGGAAGPAASLADAYTRLTSGQSGATALGSRFGMAVSGVGDINADGFDDVLFGLGYFDAGEVDEGVVFVFHGATAPAVLNQPPVPDAGSNQTFIDVANNNMASITADGRASFDPDGSLVSYEWRLGETVLGTSPVLTTTLPATGDYGLALNVTDDQGLVRGDLVTIRVEPAPSSTAANDNFSSGGLDGGFGWPGSWQTTGSVTLSSVDSFPGAPQALLAAGSTSLTRTVTLPAGTTGLGVQFWAKLDLFASTDQVDVQISQDGGPFTTVRTFTIAESGTGYHFYGGSVSGGPITLSWYPATATTADIRFQLSSASGVFYVDDISVKAIRVPAGTPVPPSGQRPVSAAGSDVSIDDADGDGFEVVALDGSSSQDPDGSIVSYEWYETAALLGTGPNLSAAFDVGAHTVQLLVTDNDGGTSSDTVTVTVVEVPVVGPPPVIDSFTATPVTTTVGSSVTLDWVTTHATDVSINGVASGLPLDGSTVVTPVVTTIYQLTATGSGGLNTANVTVTVTPVGIAGDINGDSTVDAADVLLATRAVLGLYILTPDQMQRADVAPLVAGVPSPDGLFNVSDLLLIQLKALGIA